MRLIIADETQIDNFLDQAIRTALCTCFERNRELFSKGRFWRGNVPLYSVLAMSGDLVCGHAVVTDRTILIGSRKTRIAGLANVCVLPQHRRTGLIDRLLAEVMAEAEKRQFELGLLFAGEYLKKVYARSGWIEIEGTEFTRIENNTEIIIPVENIKMYFPLLLKSFPPGNVHLCGDKW